MNIDVEQNGAVHSNPDPGKKIVMNPVLFNSINEDTERDRQRVEDRSRETVRKRRKDRDRKRRKDRDTKRKRVKKQCKREIERDR